jgi:transposase
VAVIHIVPSVARTKQQRLVEDRLWELIEPLLPPRPVPKGPGGRPRVDERAALEGILFVLHTGCRWRDLPLQLGYGSEHTAWRRLRAWQAAGGVESPDWDFAAIRTTSVATASSIGGRPGRFG